MNQTRTGRENGAKITDESGDDMPDSGKAKRQVFEGLKGRIGPLIRDAIFQALNNHGTVSKVEVHNEASSPADVAVHVYPSEDSSADNHTVLFSAGADLSDDMIGFEVLHLDEDDSRGSVIFSAESTDRFEVPNRTEIVAFEDLFGRTDFPENLRKGNYSDALMDWCGIMAIDDLETDAVEILEETFQKGHPDSNKNKE